VLGYVCCRDCECRLVRIDWNEYIIYILFQHGIRRDFQLCPLSKLNVSLFGQSTLACDEVNDLDLDLLKRQPEQEDSSVRQLTCGLRRDVTMKQRDFNYCNIAGRGIKTSHSPRCIYNRNHIIY
jgi:hypothetical protein